MATKDRTSLKNDFANGKYAIGEKFADLIDSMKVVQLPVVDPQALGTSLSFIDSISQDADGKITATKKTLDLANAHELNPFKGWYKTGDTLPTDGFDGAYLYFKDTSELTGQTTIYRWNGTTYADTGTVVDTSNVQTFETGQAVNGVAIDNTGLKNAVREGVVLPQAGDVQLMKQQLKGVTLEETKASTGTLYNGVLNANTKEFVGTQGAARYCVIPLNGATKVRFNGVSYGDANTSYYYGFGFYDSEDNIIGTQAYEGRGDSGSNTVKEYFADVPEGAVSLICSVILASSVLNESNFYCYLDNGSTVLDMMPTVVDNLETNDASKALSARQGVLLNERISVLDESLRERVNLVFSNFGVVSYQALDHPDGYIATSEYYKYSNPIFIKQGYTVNVLSRGSGFGVISTCNSDGTNVQVVVGTPIVSPVPSDYVAYTYTAPTDCYIIVCGQFYYQDYPAIGYYLGGIKINDNMENKTFTAELTMAYVSSGGNIYQSADTDSLDITKKYVANIYWIEIGKIEQGVEVQCTPFEPINTGETYKVYFFDNSFASLSNVELTESAEYKALIPSGAKYMRLVVTSVDDLPYSVRYVEVKVKTDLLRKCCVRNYLTTSDYITNDGTLKYYRTIFEVPYKGQRLWNVGWFFYSPYYKPVGEKTKLVILYTGSDAYKFNQDWNAFSLNYKSIVFSLVHSGYNVALCSCLASLYGPNSATTAISDCSGDQLSINAYQAYYEYLVKNFNVEENPYILGYSNGGLPSGRINILGDIPAKAITGGAIVTDLVVLLRSLAMPVNINKILHNCGVPTDVGIAGPKPDWTFSAADYNVLKSQGDILRNYSPLFMSCDGLDWDTWIDTMKDVSFVDMETNQALEQLMSGVKLQSKVPIKIWHSRDDVNVPYGLSKFYVNAVNRGGGRAFLRTMPDNAGGHAMGNYGNTDSIKVQDYHFKDGTVADTTLFMSEVIDWFNQWK